MPRISDILNTARRALNTQNAAIQVTSHNIANANTEGYSRQRVSMTPSGPLLTDIGVLGTGVEVDSIERIRNSYLDTQLSIEYQDLGLWEYRERIFGEIESVLAEPSDTGLGEVLTQFWDSWQELANNPESTSVRELVRQRGLLLVDTMNSLNENLASVQRSLDSELGSLVEEVNELGREISILNKEIANVEATGVTANDLRDQRDLLVGKLSRLVDIRSVEASNGMIHVTVGGEVFVGYTEVREMQLGSQVSGSVALSYPRWSQRADAARIEGGQIGGLLEMRDQVIPQYMEKLDTLAVALANGVNDVHISGQTLDGSTGIPFFDTATTGAGDIALHSAILDSVNAIAASADGSAGNGEIALEINQLKDEYLLENGHTSISDFYSAMIGALGLDADESVSMLEHAESYVTELENRRESISGVSTDEEMTDLIRYQYAFEAAARLVTTIDEMMQTIVDMV